MDRLYLFKINIFKYRVGKTMCYTANADRPCSLHMNNRRGQIHTNFGEWHSWQLGDLVALAR